MVLIEYIGLASPDQVHFIRGGILKALTPAVRESVHFTSTRSVVTRETSLSESDERPIIRITSDNQWQHIEVLRAVNTTVHGDPLIVSHQAQFQYVVSGKPATTSEHSDW